MQHINQTQTAFAVDALTLSWNDLNVYAFPPFAIVHRVLDKIVQNKVTLRRTGGFRLADEVLIFHPGRTWKFCCARGTDPFSAPLPVGINFLASLASNGTSCSANYAARSALPAFLPQCGL